MNFELQQFTDWLLDNHYRKDVHGLYYSAINSTNGGEKFTFEELVNEYHLDIYSKVITNILTS